MIYFTSDLHLSHNKNFVYEARGFKDIDEHNQAIIDRWNETVTDEDDVYILGDIMLNDTVDTIPLLGKLKGNIYFIAGNHDTNRRIEIYETLGWKYIGVASMFKYKKYHFYLSHYKTMISNCDDGKSLKERVINLYGHTHQTLAMGPDINVDYNVGVDAHDCRPVSIEKIVEDLRAEYPVSK